MIDTGKIRVQFPILNLKVNNYPLIYFDNGATTQKPLTVINSVTEFYTNANSNIHRGVHSLSRIATERFEQARKTLAQHFNVNNEQQLVFTAGTTDSINKVAQGLARGHFKKGDEIILSTYEHHSNILPWQLWAQEHGGTLKVIPLLEDQSLDYTAFEKLLSEKTKLIALAHVSNTLGLVADIQRISNVARRCSIPLLIDGAQSAPHFKINLEALNVDFFTCSAHKMYGPTGIGMLYLSEKWLNKLPVSSVGGGTVKTVSFTNTQYAEGPLRFESGTPNIAGAIAFAEAVKFMDALGMENITAHENLLHARAQKVLNEIPGVQLYGTHTNKAGVISFNVKGQHPFDVGALLDRYGIAVRTGHHCTQPLMQHLNIPGTVRISFAVYNTIEEVDFFAEKLKKVITMLG